MGHRWPVKVGNEESGEWVGEHRCELIDLQRIFEAIVQMPVEDEASSTDWRNALPQGVQFIRCLGPHSAHVRVRGAAVADIVLKVDAPSHLTGLGRLTEGVRHSRAHRRYYWAHRLRALGIDTPRPLGFVERADKPTRAKSFVASEYIFAPTLIEFRDQSLATALEAGQNAVLEKRALILRVAGFTRELHSHDLYPVDLSARRVLVRDDTLILTGMLDSGRRSLDNLVALGREFLDSPYVTRTDRMRFITAYLRHAPGGADARRTLFRQVGVSVVG